jgi:hypothetical protein
MSEPNSARLLPGDKVTMAGYPGTVVRLYADGPCEAGRMYEVRLPGGLGCYCGTDLVLVSR